ncbi:hypothetical protein [Xenorhabdus bovienii]|uniref:Uncharacterized protein n=1 Tax=Xenorhabdus bovienii str. feltiae Moldova TaxID=1398200 RepID=A0A077NCD1_XENBV|nr:hypothetical protein [Xenorhabdus bovienii]CDG99822.1 conserved hypothetical protein [Xenorhabdus bovienii str. feltiae Moldova]
MNLKHISEVVEDRLKKIEELKNTIRVTDKYFIFYFNGMDQYEIAISDCDTPEKLIPWIFHLTEKSWMSVDLLRHFIRVASNKSNISIR